MLVGLGVAGAGGMGAGAWGEGSNFLFTTRLVCLTKENKTLLLFIIFLHF